MRVLKLIGLTIVINMSVFIVSTLFLAFVSWYIEDGAVTFRQAVKTPAILMAVIVMTAGFAIVGFALSAEEERRDLFD